MAQRFNVGNFPLSLEIDTSKYAAFYLNGGNPVVSESAYAELALISLYNRQKILLLVP